MRCIAKAVALLILLSLLATSKVFAGDPVTDAAQALQHTSVYVAPGTEGTDNNTAAQLQKSLKKDDNIVLVMLPSSAGENINAIAASLSDQLENKRIIGLAVGKEVVGYAPTLPVGVAADKMSRAASVSNSPITALGTFAQNMHSWETDHPQPIPSPLGSSKKGGTSWYEWLGIGILGFVAACIVLLVFWRMATPASTEERTHFQAPGHVKDLLSSIAKARLQVNDESLIEVIRQLCLDIEKYFASSTTEKERDVSFFEEHLTEVSKVLNKYIDVQQNRRYFNDPDALLQQAKASIVSFSQTVLAAIRSGNAAALLEFTVNTDILDAQRYRYSQERKE